MVVVITASRMISGFEANLSEFMILIPFWLLSQLHGSIGACGAFVADAAGKTVICCPNHTVDRPHPPMAPVAFYKDEDTEDNQLTCSK